MPYNIGSVMGDIQGLAHAGQALMIGAFFQRRKIAERFDEIVDPILTMVALYRRVDEEAYFDWIWERRWTSVYPALATLGYVGSGDVLEADAGTAKEAVKQAALALGISAAKFLAVPSFCWSYSTGVAVS